MFILKLYDANGLELNIGDIVELSNFHGWGGTFYCEITFDEKEQVIHPFHTFSFADAVKVDSVPEGAKKMNETRFNAWYIGSKNEKFDANRKEAAQNYLIQWRACEHKLKNRMYRITEQEKA